MQLRTTSETAPRKQIAVKRLSVRVRAGRNVPDALKRLDRGEVSAYVSDFILLKRIEMDPRNLGKYKVTGVFLSYDPYALILPRNDSRFRQVENRRLARLFRDQKIHKIHDRYFSRLREATSKLLVYSIAVQSFPE